MALTHSTILDPIIAIRVGVNILFTGYRLVRRSVVGLLIATLPPEDVERVPIAAAQVCHEDVVGISDLRSRELAVNASATRHRKPRPNGPSGRP